MADTTSLHLRLPKRLYKRLQQQARRNNVSLNTEIVNQLEGHEAATIKRTAEIVQPLLDKAVRDSATIAAERATSLSLVELYDLATEEEFLQALGHWTFLSPEHVAQALAIFRKRKAKTKPETEGQ